MHYGHCLLCITLLQTRCTQSQTDNLSKIFVNKPDEGRKCWVAVAGGPKAASDCGVVCRVAKCASASSNSLTNSSAVEQFGTNANFRAYSLLLKASLASVELNVS